MFTKQKLTISAALAAVMLLGGCENGIDLGRLSNPFQRNQPDAVPSINRPAADNRGVITYETYQVIVARENDSLTEMAARVGITATELADFNGLPVRHTPHVGEVLALPENVGGAVVASPSGWSEEIATSAIENAGGTGSVGNPSEPLRHRVQSGETAYSIARQYNVSVTALSTWNGLDSDLTVRPNQQLIIPVPDTGNVPVSTVAPPAPQVSDTQESPEAAVVPETPPASNAPFITPVEGTISRGYKPTGRNKNEGLDYTTIAGATVSAAADGTVALVSDSLGALGTIVLIRHSNDLMTVYGRVTDVQVEQGDQVEQGQQVGIVAPSETPTFHFEVRVGTESVDPAQYIR